MPSPRLQAKDFHRAFVWNENGDKHDRILIAIHEDGSALAVSPRKEGAFWKGKSLKVERWQHWEEINL